MNDMLTTEEALERLKITRSTLYRWMQNGELKAYKLGKKTLFKPEDLDALVVPRPQLNPNEAPGPEEMADLLSTIAISEIEKAEGVKITKADIQKRIADRIADARLNRSKLASA